MVIETPDGRSIQVVNEPLADGGWVATHEDITERRRAEERITHLAHYDALTDLPNRALFHEQLEARTACTSRRASNWRCSTSTSTNSRASTTTLGHHDRRRIAEIGGREPRPVACSDTDFVARLGGDEFAIVQTAVRTRDRRHRARRRGSSMRSGSPIECLGHQVTTDASIGIALAPQHGADLDQILKNADLAMYAAKAAGRRTYRFFEPEMDAQVRARRILEMDLRQAIADGALRGLLPALRQSSRQQDHRLRGAAALAPSRTRHDLARRIHSDCGRHRPDQSARRMGADDGLRGSRDLARRYQARGQRLAGSVQERHAGAEDRLRRWRPPALPASRLELEITEAVLIRDDEAALAILHQLRAIGVRIALDDFGTGYSSLSYLQRFPFDKIKIDRCFVNDIAEPDGSSGIVQAVVNIAAGAPHDDDRGRRRDATAAGIAARARLLGNAGLSVQSGQSRPRRSGSYSAANSQRARTSARAESDGKCRPPREVQSVFKRSGDRFASENTSNQQIQGPVSILSKWGSELYPLSLDRES